MDRGSWHCTGGSDQGHPQEKEMQKGKMAVWGGFINSWEKKSSKRQRRKGKITHFNEEFRIARRDKKAFLSDQCKEIDEKIEWKRLEISVGSLLAWNLVARSWRWESERRKEANISWVTQLAFVLQGISQEKRDREKERKRKNERHGDPTSDGAKVF